MNLIQRIVSFVTPPCGHEDELHSLRNRLQAAILSAENAKRELTVVDRARRRATERAELLEGKNAETEAALREAIERGGKLGEEKAAVARENTDLRLQRALALEHLEEASSSLEEANSRIAILEQELRAAKAEGFRAQTSMIERPDASDALPIPEDEVVSDKHLELAYRLVGIYFEGRQHWILARGEERIKAPIHDAGWLEQMRRGEVQFRAGDTLLAEFHVVTYRRGGEVWAEHTVERVIRVIHADEQIEMPLTGEATQSDPSDALARNCIECGEPGDPFHCLDNDGEQPEVAHA